MKIMTKDRIISMKKEKKYIEYILKQAEALLAIDSPSGFTEKVTDYLCEEYKRLGYKPVKTKKGGVLVEIGGKGNAVLTMAHVDTLGGMVAEIKSNGRLRLTRVGGLNANNIDNYAGENMYCSRLGYISPIWSRELTLQLMKTADDEHWDITVHDCSNDTKFARGLNLSAKEGKWFGASNYACEFSEIPYEVFLPILREEQFQFLSEEPLPAQYQPMRMDD